MSFLTEEILKGTDWRALERAVARLVSHCGWRGVAVVGTTGDKGADILAVREGRPWIIQVKAVTGGNYVGQSALGEAISALSTYSAKSAAVATNGEFTRSAFKRQDELARAGYDLKLWNGMFLRELLGKWPAEHPERRGLRPYQKTIVEDLTARIDKGENRGHYVMATGLGKTVVAAELTRRLFDMGFRNALVLCHSQDLALQLDRAFWPHLKSSERTSVFFEGKPPKRPEGVTFGLYQTLLGYLPSVESDQYGLVVIDEAHHALASGFLACIDHLKPKYLLGMTATPWRGDGDSIDRVFGSPIAKVSLVDGMAMGFLAEVDYRILCDNIRWKEISHLSKRHLSIRNLNKTLFVPQRDEAAIGKIIKAMAEIESPKLIVFSPSIQHAAHFASLLNASGVPTRNISGVDRVSRQKFLMDFSAGRLQALTAVDLLNEGIDVPDVNMLAFMRATHSRRIFVQQLGRGLRLAHGKRKVVVLDFVSDIRRLAEVMRMNREAKAGKMAPEAVYLKDGFVRFDDERAGPFVEEWIKDAANLSDKNESYALTFPGYPQ